MKRLIGALALVVMLSSWSGRAAAVESWEVAAADVLTGVVPLGALGLAQYKEDKEGRRQWFWSTATSLVVNTAARVAFNDTDYGERPNGHPYGFPSGHMSFIVSGGAFLQERYGYRWGVPAHLMSAYVAYVRVETGHHRWRDVIAAAALSYGVSRIFVTPYETEVAVAPLVSEDGTLGVQLGYAW
jgi:hypothetical protein